MVHNCAIISCPLHNRRNIRKGLLFHSFPVDQHRFELWRQIVFSHCSQTLSINKHSKICFRHFRPDDYIANHTGLTRYLKATAIPSIFTDQSTNTTMMNSNILYNHLIPTSVNSNSIRSVQLNSLSSEIASPLNLVLPSKSSSSSALATTTNPKVKRLLNTIDKLHQIQNANKNIGIQKSTIENEQINTDDATTNRIIEQQTLNPIQISHDNNLLLDNPAQTTDSFIIDHKNLIQDQESTQNTFQHSSISTTGFRWTQNTSIILPKSHLDDMLYKFLEQANLLQYYSAFMEQGGDDLKQLAEAQNDDFEEIITLVGMISKPLHVKRFKKALADYRRSLTHSNVDSLFSNNSYSTVSSHALPTDETLSDHSLYSSLIHSTSVSSSPRPINQISSNWCSNKTDNSKSNNMHQLLDDNQRKMIADEAERIANLLPVPTNKKFNGRTSVSKDIVNNMSLPRDFEDRWQRIRKYAAIYNRSDSKTSNQTMSLHEILINEAAAAICFHRPEFLTRRDELLHLARRILQNIGISTIAAQKRSLNILKCDVGPAKQIKLSVPLSKTPIRQRDPEAFRLMWHNRETKVEQIPIEIEALRCEQNKLLQQLKQNTIDSTLSSSVDNLELKNQIDDIGRKMEQLSDEEKNLRRLIRKKNMRLRAKERQQQRQQQMAVNYSSTLHDLMLPVMPMTPSPTTMTHDICQNRQPFENKSDMQHSISIKNEKIEPVVNIASPVLKTRNELFKSSLTAKIIDRRRDEVNDRLVIVDQKNMIPDSKSCRSIHKKQSSSTTVIGSIQNCDELYSQVSTNVDVPTFSDEQDIMESKHFVQNLEFDVPT